MFGPVGSVEDEGAVAQSPIPRSVENGLRRRVHGPVALGSISAATLCLV